MEEEGCCCLGAWQNLGLVTAITRFDLVDIFRSFGVYHDIVVWHLHTLGRTFGFVLAVYCFYMHCCWNQSYHNREIVAFYRDAMFLFTDLIQRIYLGTPCVYISQYAMFPSCHAACFTHNQCESRKLKQTECLRNVVDVVCPCYVAPIP